MPRFIVASPVVNASAGGFAPEVPPWPEVPPRPQVLWICSFPSSFELRHGSANFENAELFFPAADAMPIGLDYEATSRQLAPHSANAETYRCLALGVALVTQGSVWQGPLSVWSPGARLQKQYFGNDNASAFAVVQRVHRLREPKELFFRVDDHGRDVKLNISHRSIIFRPVGIKGDEVFAHPWPPPCCRVAGTHAVQVPDVLAKALMDGTMKEIVLLPRWTALWPNFPPNPVEIEIDHAPPAGGAAPENNLPHVSNPQQLADQLCKWAPAIVAAHGGSVAAELEKHVIWLREFAQSHSQPSRGPGKTQRWDSRVALFFFRGAWALRDFDNLPMAIRSMGAATEAAQVPIEKSADLERRGLLAPKRGELKDRDPCPSGSTLRKMAFYIDVAAMLWERRRRTRFPPVASYGWADSSPQGGRDWLISKMCSVREREGTPTIVDAARLAIQLRHLSLVARSSHETEVAKTEAARQIPGIVKELRACLHVRVLPPAALGLRRTDAAHKSAAFLHSLAMESPSDLSLLRRELDGFVSFTTDLGVEAGLSDFRIPSLAALLPSWVVQSFTPPQADPGLYNVGAEEEELA